MAVKKESVVTTPTTSDSLSKAERVRAYMEENPKASPKEVSDALSKHGITAQYVSLIKMKHNSKKRAERVVMPPDAQLTYSVLMIAANLIKECGGPEQAKLAINAVAELSAGIKFGA